MVLSTRTMMIGFERQEVRSRNSSEEASIGIKSCSICERCFSDGAGAGVFMGGKLTLRSRFMLSKQTNAQAKPYSWDIDTSRWLKVGQRVKFRRENNRGTDI